MKLGWLVSTLALGVAGSLASACSGATSDSKSGGATGGAAGAGGSGGSSIGSGGGWPDGGGGAPNGGSGGSVSGGGSGGSTGGTGGSGGVGGSTGGAGGSGGGAGGSSGGAGGSSGGAGGNSGGSGGGCVAKSCKNYTTCQTEQLCVATCPSAPAEICNLKDDNCDGNCDDFSNCRVGVNRSVNPATGEHFYTTSATEAVCCGYQLESANFYYLYSAQTGTLVPFYRCALNIGKHFYTTSSNCEGAPGVNEGTLGYIATSAVCGAVALYRTAHANGDHFFTTSSSERDYAVSTGYVDEGIAGYVWTGP